MLKFSFMRKLFFMAALASVAFASCTKDENFYENESTNQEISFTPVNHKPGTRAMINGAAYPKEVPFKVWAWKGSKSDGTNSTDFMKGVEVKFHELGTIDAWAPDVPYYWPSGEKVDFFAVSPASLKPTVASSTDIKISDYTVNSTYNTPDAVDLMYAEKVKGLSNNTTSGSSLNLRDGVGLTFKHALAQVKFKVNMKDPSSTSRTMVLKSIKMEGVNTVNTLSFAKNDLTASWGVSKTPGEWTLTGQSTSITTSPSEIIGTTSTDGWIVIPQNVADGIKVTLTVSINNQADTEYVAQLNKATSSSIAEWQMGKIYTYSITLNAVSPDEIFFVPSVTDWVNEGGNIEL